MLNLLYPILIIIGSTIGAVLAYLWWQARAASQINVALIRLNEHYKFDVPSFLQHAWPLLAQSGLRGIRWQLDWFGVNLEGCEGETRGNSVEKIIAIGEMKVTIHFQQNRPNERRYFDIALMETFLLLLRTDMWIKAGAIDATLHQMSKLTLFLQHDMKNVAQFIQLMADQLESVPEGKEKQVLHYLRAAAPLMRHRADRIVQTLTLGQIQDDAQTMLQLNQVLAQLGDLYQLDYTISGTAQIQARENTLESALDNILKNYSDIYQREGGTKPRVTIKLDDHAHQVCITISANNVVPTTHVERLFEPFWSSDPAGLGIGLYQAKHMLDLCHATICATQTPAGTLEFHIALAK